MSAAPEVLVLGAGPAGCSAALTLARGGARVLLVHAPRPAAPLGESLPPAGVALLHTLGAGALLQGQPPSPGVRSVWGSAAVGHHDFLLSPWAQGVRLDRARLEEGLLELAADAGVTVLRGRARPRPGGEVWVGGRVLRAPWRVDATGRGAALARAEGARRVLLDPLTAVGAIGPGTDPDPRPLVEARPEGWWYRAALPGGGALRLLFGEPGGLPADPQAWTRLLRGCSAVDAPPTPPAALRPLAAWTAWSDPVGGEGWLAVGDAAACVDPLSSAGVSSALRSGHSAARAILEGCPEQHLAGERRAFESLLQGRDAVYALERRWAAQPFWCSRPARVWLDPGTLLRAGRGALPQLTRSEQARARGVLPAPAAVVVGALGQGGSLSPRRALLALQAALESGALRTG